MKKIVFYIFLCLYWTNSYAGDIEKKLLYNSYTLDDLYPYQKTVRSFQWDQIATRLDSLSLFMGNYSTFAVLNNYKNFKGIAPLPQEYTNDEYGSIVDLFGVPKAQSIPLYNSFESSIPERYARDGSLVAILEEDEQFYLVIHPYIGGQWAVPKKYVTPIDTKKFEKVIFVDRKNQNITSLELVDSIWVARSMNPATTGAQRPPHQRKTPLGLFVLQAKTPKMFYFVDGTKEIGGFAPYASRFCGGAYIHGIPVNAPQSEMIEYSATLGTTPRSHMCVRNATSHAKFIYEWTKIYETIIYIIE